MPLDKTESIASQISLRTRDEPQVEGVSPSGLTKAMDYSPPKQPRPPSAFGPPSLDFIGEDSDKEWTPKHFQQRRKSSNLDPKAAGFKTDEIAWKIYKGGAALSFKPILPSFVQKEIGVTVERNGALLIEAAPMLAPRVYDWKSKIVLPGLSSRGGSEICSRCLH